MSTGFLELCEALGGPLGKLIVILMAFGLIWMFWWVDRRLADRRKKFWEQVDRERKAFWEQSDRKREAFKAPMKEDREAHEEKADRIRAESKEQADRESEQSVRDYARLIDAIAALQADVRVLLDRSERSSGGEDGGVQRGAHHEVARQATTAQCEADAKTSSDQPVAPLPSASAAKDAAD